MSEVHVLSAGACAELPRRGCVAAAVARVMAGFLGGFSLLNLAGDLVTPGFDANIWWIDFRPAPRALADALLLTSGVLLVAYAARPMMAAWRRIVTQGLILVLVAAAAWNVAAFYRLLASGKLAAGVPVPMSLVVGAALGAILLATRRREVPAPSRRARAAALAAVAIMVAGFPLMQMYLYGKTDYRRPADLIVVFGAGVHADGRCSDALADRMRTACRLYRDGYAPRLVLSGGPGMGDIHETEGMRRLAVSLGVPDDAIILDRDGVNTAATVRNTADLAGRLGAHRILAVSHFYHLPRIKMAFQRSGMEVFTVPAHESYLLRAMPWYLTREVAALWAYYFRPLVGELG